MKKDKSNHLYHFVSTIYVNISQSQLKSSKFLLFLYLFEVTHIFLSLDIIFNKFKSSLNFTFPIYFISPIFWVEIFTNNISSSSCQLEEASSYTNDQISILLESKLSIPIHSCNCVYNSLFYFTSA